MNNKNALIAALAVTTMLSGGFAFAANEHPSTADLSTKRQTALDKDAMRLSADASQAYRDVAATRLAIFDGRIDDAKKDVNAADAGFDKAKADQSVFTKAEADLKMPSTKDAQTGDKAAAAAKSDTADAAKAVAWLPIDGQILLNEDYRLAPQKTAAVAEANKSLAHNDREGAIEKLKLANVDVDYVVAVVPLDRTLADVHKAAELMNNGKYYEASQALRNVQTSARIDVVDVRAVPKQAKAKAMAPSDQKPATTH